MVNDIMDAVARKLGELFGAETVIDTNPPEQGTADPGFFVSHQESSRKPMLGRRYFQETGFCIQYVPEKTVPDRSRELNRVAEVLLDGLEYITLADGSLIRGTARRCQTEKGVLDFFVSYNMFLTAQEEEKERMETVVWKGGTGDGTKAKC